MPPIYIGSSPISALRVGALIVSAVYVGSVQAYTANTDPVAPTNITLSVSSVSESASVGTVVGTLSANGYPTSTYSKILDAGSKFSVVGNELRIAAALDYETATSHSVTVRATNASGSYDKIFTVSVTNATELPVNTVAPSISGPPTQGGTLTGSDGTWTSAAGAVTYARQWLRDGTAISGATGSTYALDAADVGAMIGYRVTATNSDGSTQTTSATVGPVAENAVVSETLRYGVSAPVTKTSTTSVPICWIPFLPCHQSGSLSTVSVFFKAAGNYKLLVLRQIGETWDEVYKSASRTVAGAGLVSLTAADFGSVAMLPGDLVGIYCGTVGMAYETVAGVGCYYVTKSGETTATGNVLTPNTSTQQSLQINYTVTGPVQPSKTLFNEGFDGVSIPWRWKHANGAWTYANGKATSGTAGNLNALEYRFEIGHLAQWTWITRFMFETAAARMGVLTRNNSQNTFGSFIEVKQGTGDLVVYAAYSINGSLSALNTYPTGISFAVGTEYEIKVQKSFRTKTITVSNPAVPAETYSVTINEEDAIATSLPTGNWYGAPSFTPVAGTVSVISTRFDVPTARPDLFFVGDSNTEGSGQNNSSTTVARRVATARGQTLQTSAQGGASTLHTPKRLMGEIAHIAPSWAVVSIGTNDTVTADWQARMGAAYDYLSGICKKAIIAAVPPETADTNPELVMNPYIIGKGWPTVRYDLALTNPATGLAADRNASLFYDSLHCNAAGTAAEAARFAVDQPA